MTPEAEQLKKLTKFSKTLKIAKISIISRVNVFSTKTCSSKKDKKVIMFFRRHISTLTNVSSFQIGHKNQKMTTKT